MKGLTDYITEQPWEDTLIATYVLVVDRFAQAAQMAQFVRTRGPEPDYDDAQIITIALAADFGFAGDEEKTRHFLRQYHPTLWSNGIPDTARFNVRHRELVWVRKPCAGCCGPSGAATIPSLHPRRAMRASRPWTRGFVWSTAPPSL
ncbi:MAG: hypothetical protein HY741_30140 [Chloroflexi bacterium]|nr:hypothetical protein [Chloroflexota bacterium]